MHPKVERPIPAEARGEAAEVGERREREEMSAEPTEGLRLLGESVASDRAHIETERRPHALADADRRKDEFMAIAGHELRNSLAPMTSALDVIRARVGGDSDKELAVLDRQLRHMVRLVDDLLDVARIGRDTIPLSRRRVAIGELVAHSVDIASPQIAVKRHRLHVDVPKVALYVEVDPERIVQVLGNLLTNAAKFTDEGGTIRVRAAASVAQVVVTVEDTGIGIPPALAPTIFELFTQGRQGIERQPGGLGVGLAVARRFVDAHGGRLEVFSDGIGHGSRFTMRLPRLREEREEPLTTPSGGPSPVETTRSPKRVLIVDDSEDSVEMMAAVVRMLGHDARTAGSGPRALEIAREYHPDVMFFDIGLPGMDGLELVRHARRLPGCESIPIVAVSGYTSASDRGRALDAGFSEHLPKPIEPATIESLIEGAARRR